METKYKVDDISLDHVYDLYPKIINIEEYYIPNKGWASFLPGNIDIKTPKLYYNSGLKKVLLRVINMGASMVQFKCQDKDKEYCYADYRIQELIKI